MKPPIASLLDKLFLVLNIAGYNENISQNSVDNKYTHCVKDKPFSKAGLH